MSHTDTRRWALPVAAALVLLAGGAAWATARPSDDPATPLAKAPATSAVVKLASGGDGAARCDPRPDPAHLAKDAEFAFEGTVISVTPGNGTQEPGEDETPDVVTLAVTKMFKGPQAGTVQVAQQSTADHSIEDMVGSGTFDLGKTYLVASSGGSVRRCFQSGEADDPALRDLYAKAF